MRRNTMPKLSIGQIVFHRETGEVGTVHCNAHPTSIRVKWTATNIIRSISKYKLTIDPTVK